jgi:hypothetical protein
MSPEAARPEPKSEKPFIHRDMDPIAYRTKQLLGLISQKEYADIVLRHLPHLDDEIAMLKYFDMSPDDQKKQIADASRQTLIGSSEKAKMMGDQLWWGHLARIAGDDRDARSAVINGIQMGDIFMGGQKAPGGYWLNMEADEAKSENPVKITGVDGVHMHEIAVYDKPDEERESYAKKLQRGLAQLGMEMVANIADRATDDHDFSGADKEKRIPRTGTMQEREVVKQNAQTLLAQMMGYSTATYAGCRNLDEVVTFINNDDRWKGAKEVRIVRKDGTTIRLQRDKLDWSGPQKLIDFMTNESLVAALHRQHDQPDGREHDMRLEESVERDDNSIPTLRYFDVLGLSHVGKPLTAHQHTHDMSVWVGAEAGEGKVFDRKLPFRNGKMGFKVRLLSDKGGKAGYVDTTIDRILELDPETLQKYIEDPTQLRNITEKNDDLAGIEGEPPMFILSCNDSENSNTYTSTYKYRADRGRAVTHLIYNQKKNTVEMHSSHGSVDGVEAKWMALAAGYSIGTRDEKVQDSVYEMPEHRSLLGKLKKRGRVENAIHRLRSWILPPNEEEQIAAVDDLMYHDVVSFRQINFKKDFKEHLVSINESFQGHLKDNLKKAIRDINTVLREKQHNTPGAITAITEEDQQILIDILTPEFGISNVLSAASEYVFGKTAVCVQPIRKEHRLSLALTPHIAELVKILVTPGLTPKEFKTHVKELEIKMMEATHQTNLFSKLSIGHIQMLYLAAQNWRRVAEKATTWLQQPLVEATRIRAQVSALGANFEKEFTEVSPFSGKVPTTYSFTSALSGEKHLHTSIAFEGSSISFRQKLTPELFNSFSLDNKENFIHRPATRLVLDRIFGNGDGAEQKKHEALMSALDAQEALIETKFKRLNEDLNNSQALARLMESQDWEKHRNGMQLYTLILMEEKIDEYMETAKTFVARIDASLRPPSSHVTAERAKDITIEMRPTTLQIPAVELGK